jgi:hypothetical protein
MMYVCRQRTMSVVRRVDGRLVFLEREESTLSFKKGVNGMMERSPKAAVYVYIVALLSRLPLYSEDSKDEVMNIKPRAALQTPPGSCSSCTYAPRLNLDKLDLVLT